MVDETHPAFSVFANLPTEFVMADVGYRQQFSCSESEAAGLYLTKCFKAMSNFPQRFLVGTPIGDTKSRPPTGILKWLAALKK